MTADAVADVVAIVALVVSGGLGGASLAQSRKALRTSQAREERQTKDLVLYLEKAIDWSEPPFDDNRTLLVHLTLTNPADRPNSVVRADLHVTYSVDAIITAVQVPHSTQRARSNALDGRSSFELPMQIAETGAVSGWFVFEIPYALTGGRRINRYDVVIEDVHGVASSRQVTIFRDEPRA